MYKKTISGLTLVAAAFGLAAFSVPASASWSSIYVNGVNQGGQAGPLDYAGPYSLHHWTIGSVNCTLTAESYLDIDSSGQLTIEMTDLTSSGSSSCSAITFDNLPLVFESTTGPAPLWTSPVSMTSNGTLNIDDINFLDVCDDYITITFSNDGSGGSSITISQTMSGYFGDCTIDADLANSSVEVY